MGASRFFSTRAALAAICLSLAPGCDGVASPPSAAVGAPGSSLIASCSFAVEADPVLEPLVAEAALRWSLATGCDIYLAPDGSGQAAAAFRLVARIFRPDGSEAPGVTNAERTLAEVSARAGRRQRGDTVLHELGHVLGGDHTESLGVLSGTAGHSTVIDAEALESVCSRLPCRALSPEDP